jgi:hypothetical protein
MNIESLKQMGEFDAEIFSLSKKKEKRKKKKRKGERRK